MPDLLNEADFIHIMRERESPIAQAFPGENLGHDKVDDHFDEIMNPNTLEEKPKTSSGFLKSKGVQKALTFAATTLALGLSISAILLYKDTVTESIAKPDLLFAIDL